MQVRLADEHRARFTQAGDDGGVDAGAPIVQHARGGRRRLTGDVDQILQRDRNAVERPAIESARSLGVDRGGRARRPSSSTRMNALVAGLNRGDGGQRRLDEVAGGGGAGAKL